MVCFIDGIKEVFKDLLGWMSKRLYVRDRKVRGGVGFREIDSGDERI